MDTNPSAPDVDTVLAGQEEDFEVGLAALAKMVGDAKTFLCRAPGSLKWLQNQSGIEIAEFEGPHPAGTVGLHIHTLASVDRERNAWHIGYQDVAAAGHLLKTGHLYVERIVSLAGSAVRKPRLLRTRIGASIDALVQGELIDGENRVLTGSVFCGRVASGEALGYLGRYHSQITALLEGRKQQLFGWLGLGLNRFSFTRLFLSRLAPKKKRTFDTNAGGGQRTMVPVGLYEKVFAFDLLVTPLLRALLAEDDERAEELGCLELEEEDLALCSFICPCKIDYGVALRKALSRIEEEG
jgi:Na+-transporting NADH:ubiquinone oxidoreductase subunit A